MSYDHEEFDYLCALFDASRDALRLHSGWEDIAEEFDELGAAVRQSDFSTQILERIKQAIINSFWMDLDPNDEVCRGIMELRGRALLRTVALLKQSGEAP